MFGHDVATWLGRPNQVAVHPATILLDRIDFSQIQHLAQISKLVWLGLLCPDNRLFCWSLVREHITVESDQKGHVDLRTDKVAYNIPVIGLRCDHQQVWKSSTIPAVIYNYLGVTATSGDGFT